VRSLRAAKHFPICYFTSGAFHFPAACSFNAVVNALNLLCWTASSSCRCDSPAAHTTAHVKGGACVCVPAVGWGGALGAGKLQINATATVSWTRVACCHPSSTHMHPLCMGNPPSQNHAATPLQRYVGTIPSATTTTCCCCCCCCRCLGTPSAGRQLVCTLRPGQPHQHLPRAALPEHT
jgi:hypothetical protein